MEEKDEHRTTLLNTKQIKTPHWPKNEKDIKSPHAIVLWVGKSTFVFCFGFLNAFSFVWDARPELGGPWSFHILD